MTWTIFYHSTATERYDTDTNEKVRAFLEEKKADIVGEYGGTFLGAPADDPEASDNAFVVGVDELSARKYAKEISDMLGGREVKVIRDDDPE